MSSREASRLTPLFLLERHFNGFWVGCYVSVSVSVSVSVLLEPLSGSRRQPVRSSRKIQRKQQQGCLSLLIRSQSTTGFIGGFQGEKKVQIHARRDQFATNDDRLYLVWMPLATARASERRNGEQMQSVRPDQGMLASLRPSSKKANQPILKPKPNGRQQRSIVMS